MNKRKSISKRVRFDVFKRDNFTCQYCGKKAPDVVLEIDHINPVSKGGTNTILNLITSCYDCNRGKSNKVLSENQTLSKELKQMEQLAKRKEQIDMMFKWQNELLNQDNKIVEELSNYFCKCYGFNGGDYGLEQFRKALKKYEVNEIMNGCKVIADVYPEISVGETKILKMLSSLRLQTKKPYMKQIFYIRGILRNRLSNDRDYNDKEVLKLLVKFYEQYDVSLEELQKIAITENSMEELYMTEGYYDCYKDK